MWVQQQCEKRRPRAIFGSGIQRNTGSAGLQRQFFLFSFRAYSDFSSFLQQLQWPHGGISLVDQHSNATQLRFRGGGGFWYGLDLLCWLSF